MAGVYGHKTITSYCRPIGESENVVDNIKEKIKMTFSVLFVRQNVSELQKSISMEGAA